MKVSPINRKFGRYAPGDEFDLPDKAARVFIRAGKLSEVKYEAKVVTPDPEISERTGQPKRQYRRRDMTPEG